MNAAKKIRLLLEQGTAPAQVEVLLQLVASLQLGVGFELRRLYQLDQTYFELGMALLKDWRFDHHIATRSKLLDEILLRNRALRLQQCGLLPPVVQRMSA